MLRTNGIFPTVVSPSAEFTLSYDEGPRTGVSNHGGYTAQ